MKKNLTRRDFLASTGKVLTLGILVPFSSMAITKKIAYAEEATKKMTWSERWQGKEWGFVVDTYTCIGCAKCVEACKQENDIPMDKEVYRTWVERHVQTVEGEVKIDSPKGGLAFSEFTEKHDKAYFVPKLCNQCHNAPCIQVCPVGATYKTGDGVVLVDRKRCVGCRYCIQACPYGARFLDPKLKVVDKCTWCYHRIVKGMKPACVEVCPKAARKFGNLKKANSEVSIIIKNERIGVLKPETGTEPLVYYLGLEGGV